MVSWTSNRTSVADKSVIWTEEGVAFTSNTATQTSVRCWQAELYKCGSAHVWADDCGVTLAARWMLVGSPPEKDASRINAGHVITWKHDTVKQDRSVSRVARCVSNESQTSLARWTDHDAQQSVRAEGRHTVVKTTVAKATLTELMSLRCAETVCEWNWRRKLLTAIHNIHGTHRSQKSNFEISYRNMCSTQVTHGVREERQGHTHT